MELHRLRRELHELEIQRGPERREIEELRQIVEDQMPMLDPEGPEAVVARSLSGPGHHGFEPAVATTFR